MLHLPPGWNHVTGLDEVGRGAIAGPLFAVAATFTVTDENKCPVQGVKDSKKFGSDKEYMRKVYKRILKSQELVDIGIGWVDPKEVDEMGVDPANALAFERAVLDLRWAPGYLIVDGVNRVPVISYSNQMVEPKADANHWQVGAASILAKVLRDELMTDLGNDFQGYGWEKNAGYGTGNHCDAIRKLGPTEHHRQRFIQKLLIPRVVHCKTAPFDIYVGRPSKWGNPFMIGRDGDRETVLKKYLNWFILQPHLVDSLWELKGKILGCYCAPEACHGDLLVKLTEQHARQDSNL